MFNNLDGVNLAPWKNKENKMNRANIFYNIENQIRDADGYKGGVTLERRVEISSTEMLALRATAKELIPASGVPL